MSRREKTNKSSSGNPATLTPVLKELADVKFALDVSSIIAVTDRMGKFVYVNDKFCEISKYSRNELLGQTHHVVNSKFHTPEFFENLWKTILRGQVWQSEIRDRAKNGGLYWIHTTIVPFLDEKGEPSQYVSISRDITNTKIMEEALKFLPQRIIRAQESERARISREIHDDFGQSLAILKMMIQSACQEGCFAGEDQEIFSKKSIQYLDTIIEKSRSLAHALRPSTLEVLGLTDSLKTLIEEFRNNKGLEIKYRLGNLNNILFRGEAINLYRIVQEALTNVISHAEASRVGIYFRKKKATLTVVIKDDGKGIDLDKKRHLSHSLGLSTMAERAKLLEGHFNLESHPGEGTVIRIALPIDEGEVPYV